MKKSILILVIIVILIVAGGLYYWLSQAKAPAGAGLGAVGAAQDQAASASQVKALLDKLGAHLILPTGEVPQIGTIDDPIQAAKVQPFVAGAQKGDLLIVYVKAKKAIVYSPSRDLIVNVGPITIDPAAQAAAAKQATTPTTTPVKK